MKNIVQAAAEMLYTYSVRFATECDSTFYRIKYFYKEDSGICELMMRDFRPSSSESKFIVVVTMKDDQDRDLPLYLHKIPEEHHLTDTDRERVTFKCLPDQRISPRHMRFTDRILTVVNRIRAGEHFSVEDIKLLLLHKSDRGEKGWQPDDYYIYEASVSELDDLNRITMQMAESCLIVEGEEDEKS